MTPATSATSSTASSSSVLHAASARPRRRLRSIAAVAVGFLAVALLSLATDQLLHVLEVYPPWGEPMWEPGLNLLALTYRVIFTIAGGYLTAHLAPSARMRHVLALAILGTVTATAGVIVALRVATLGPAWYPIALAVTAFPCVWWGGVLYGTRHRPA